MNHKILIIGSGGREHALAWKLKQSPRVGKIFIAPGNAGTAQIGENVEIKATDVLALADWAQKNLIDFTVVGSDDALALGVVDEFQKRGLKIWGPNKAAAQIEASKAFAKGLMEKNNIPTAAFETFDDYQKALTYIEQHFNVPSRPSASESRDPETSSNLIPDTPDQVRGSGMANPIVIKASGLALGKGVTICKNLDEAKNFLADVMVNKIFGDAGNEVIIEEFLQGKEFSVHAFAGGKSFKLLPTAQDHKPVYDGGKGPNTGGMGTIAPVPWVTKEMMTSVAIKIVGQALSGMRQQGAAFTGLLYPGLIETSDGPKVIEFNSRFGDPETQSLMRLLKSDLYGILEACVNGTIADVKIEWANKFACCIVLASGGYPGKYEKGKTISGIDEAEKLDDIIVFHAGTATSNNQLVTNGGRVLGITAIADDLQTALDKAYAAVKLIKFDGMHYRTDIGKASLA